MKQCIVVKLCAAGVNDVIDLESSLFAIFNVKHNTLYHCKI